MEENMADDTHNPNQELFSLYNAWSKGGCGLIITGNVMVDYKAMTGPGGVVLDKQSDLQLFKQWAQSAKQYGSCVVMQLNHPGRQVYKAMKGDCLSPSDVPLNLGKHSHLFDTPTPMSHQQIDTLIEQFVYSAKTACDAGFDGVQIHAAHGYLLSQFLSPLTNKRHDQYGGTIHNRARLLISIVDRVRMVIGHNKILSVKLNSADFQKGGFDVDDAIEVVKQLNDTNVDFIELSGGSYEAPAMQGHGGDHRTLSREAYFLSFATDIAQFANMPIMTTGGIQSKEVADKVLHSGVQLIGMASALACNPSLPNDMMVNDASQVTIPKVAWRDKALSGLANMALIKRQLRRLGNGKPTVLGANPMFTLVMDRYRLVRKTKQYRRWLVQRAQKAQSNEQA